MSTSHRGSKLAVTVDVLPLLRRIDASLDEIQRMRFDAFIQSDGKGAKHNLSSKTKSPINSAALTRLVEAYPSLVKDVSVVRSWRPDLESEVQKTLKSLHEGKSEERHQAAYRLGQLQQALKDPAITEALHSWLGAQIDGWSVRTYPAPSLFHVHLANTHTSGVLQQKVFALSDYVIARQVAAAASGDWPDFNAVDLALALALVKSSALSPSLLTSALKILNGFAEREQIWKNHPSATISGSSAGCSSLFACVRLLRKADRAVVARLEPALISHLNWAFDATIESCWRGSDLAGRNSEPETWFNCLCVEFFEAMRAYLKRGLEERLRYTYEAKRCDDKLSFSKLALEARVSQTLHDAFVAPVRERRPREHVSAILFGPPGTAKTTIAEAIAREIEWPLMELGVADFLSRGLEEVFSRSSEIFRDLLHVSEVVILLDEVEQVFRSRTEEADLRQKFLTSALLPPLKRLRDEKKVILLIATNFIKAFDEAASRIGRIDLILPVGPPDLDQRGKLIQSMIGIEQGAAQVLAKMLPDEMTIGDIKSLKKIEGYATLEPGELFMRWKKLFPTGASISKEQLTRFEGEREQYSRFL